MHDPILLTFAKRKPEPIAKPAAHLDAFAHDTEAPAGYGEDEINGVDPEAEAYLRKQGLAGAGAYDLGRLRREMDVCIAEGGWQPREPTGNAGTRFGRSPADLDERSELLRQSASFASGSMSRNDAAARAGARHEELTQELRGERPRRPLPTPISDLKQVLGFLERHAPESSDEVFARIAERRAETKAIDDAGGGLGRHHRRRISLDKTGELSAAADHLAAFAQMGGGRPPAAERRSSVQAASLGYDDLGVVEGATAWETQSLLEAAALEDAVDDEEQGAFNEVFLKGPYSYEGRMRLGEHALDSSLSKFGDEVAMLLERRAFYI